MPATIRFIDQQPVYRSARFSLQMERFETPDGAVERPVIHHPGAVGVIVQPAPDRILLVRQYRYPTRSWTLEIPAGTRDADETAEATAHRELREEAGLRCEALHELLRCHPAIGVSDELLIIYRAEGVHRAGDATPEHGELLEPEEYALDDLPRLCDEGLICDGKTLLALALLGRLPGAPA